MEFARVNRKRENRVLATVERRGGQLFMPNIGPSKSQATQRESTELEEYNTGDRVSNPVHFQTFLRNPNVKGFLSPGSNLKSFVKWLRFITTFQT